MGQLAKAFGVNRPTSFNFCKICVPSACQAAVSEEGWCSSVAKRFISEVFLKLSATFPLATGEQSNLNRKLKKL
jgi:hypothetical protein